MTGSAAALVSFVESSDLLCELTGVEVSASQVETGRRSVCRPHRAIGAGIPGGWAQLRALVLV